jgi:hypothetical protein
MPNDSASAPMFAAIQKWPSGRSGRSAAAVFAAAMPSSRICLLSAEGACPPSQ